MKAFLWWVSGFLAFREIKEDGRPYLERYYLFTVLGWRFYLHHFVGSDPARGLHDHPWRKAFSVILSGWYWEETSYGTRKVKWFNRLTGDTKHRVVLPDSRVVIAKMGGGQSLVGTYSNQQNPQPCWTLFAHSVGNSKPWGFYTDLMMPDYPGALGFYPYRYEKEGSQKDWWMRAKTRRAAQRVDL